MPTINVEMMKQLLQEFNEKEALTGEEIKVVEQQILELETRVTSCRDRLQNLNEDKDRLAAMMSRYTGKGNAEPLKKVGSGQASISPKSTDATQQNLEGIKIIETVQAKKGIIEDLEPAVQQGSEQKEEEKGAAGNDDAIKSINDALKGLFRK